MSVKERSVEPNTIVKTIQIDMGQGPENVDLTIIEDASMPVDQSKIDLVQRTMTIAPVRVAG